MKFSTKLLTVFSGVILFIGILIAYLAYDSNIRTLEKHIKDRLQNQTFHTFVKIDMLLYERYADIKELASDPVISSRISTPEQITERLLVHKKKLQILCLIVIFQFKQGKDC